MDGNIPSDFGNLATPDPADGNVEDDPFLVGLTPDADWTNETWLLGPSSPAIDAGDPLAPLDFDGTQADPGAFGGPNGNWLP